jgi:hypothetical protein
VTHPTEPPLPVPLPKPLSDPLRIYRWFVIIAVISIVIYWRLPDVRKVREAAAGIRQTQLQRQLETAELAAEAVTLTLLLCTLCMLPWRVTNAIYLRSFRNDASTGELRTLAQAALGPAFRLSGIRDPRRRWPALIRHLFYLLFLIRYAQPKFMNLEAGPDWKARLWRSLGEARCALIDVSELTPFVHEEIVLAIRCLGFDRILFIGDDSRTADEWRQTVLAAVKLPDVKPERIQMAIWMDTVAGRAAFRDRVREFARRLPANPPGLSAAAFPETASSSDPGGSAMAGGSWRMFLLANLIGVGIYAVTVWAQILTPGAGLAWFLPAVIYNSLVVLLLVQFFAECGSLWQRLWIGTTFVSGALVAGLLVSHVFSAGQGTGGAPGGIKVGPNMKQMGDGIRHFHERGLIHDSARRPQEKSYQFEMLPYSDETRIIPVPSGTSDDLKKLRVPAAGADRSEGARGG